jgi:hypothetical protein
VNPQRQRSLMAAQKVRVKTDPKPEQLPKLTPEERKAIYAPKAATTAPEHLQGGEWVRAWRTVEKVSYGITAICGLIFGGLIVSESKKSVRQ